ncbi:hypothetical protein BDV33DRAFT_167510 [Aspergillus novoparasiticus]|uniref:Uncharacterized protein n=1 Tax=Aspergillus novoparasiticus TaxID=986946 RepID=A0A5N6F0W4_9EURO|nr:hypothetical protein BDV33DRAFT_167510 [Aspergillus novoparasiticus]
MEWHIHRLHFYRHPPTPSCQRRSRIHSQKCLRPHPLPMDHHHEKEPNRVSRLLSGHLSG